MSHDIGHQIARFIAQHHTNDINFFKKLYCDPVFRIISKYKKQMHKCILSGKSYLYPNFLNVYAWDQNENTRIWINITSRTIVNDPITNNSTTMNSTTMNSTTMNSTTMNSNTNDPINPDIIPLYFYDKHEKIAFVQFVNELDLKIIQCNGNYSPWYILSWEHWKIE